MGMSIDKAIETLLDTRSYGTADIAKSVAIDTMRKYQKIEDIFKIWHDWSSPPKLNSVEAMEKIGEVLKDGNAD